MAKKATVLKIAALVAVFFVLAYFIYDGYFQLPSGASSETDLDRDSQFLGQGQFDILILGLDGREYVNDRTDTIILVSINPQTKETQVLSIPRDTRVKVKGHWDKINAAYAYGGLELTVKTIEDFLGLTVDRYVIANFESVVQLADQVGGVQLDVPMRMYVPLEGIDLHPGFQQLNGEQILAYSRFRGTPEGDIGRAARQQEVLTLLAKRVLGPENLTRLPQLVSFFREHVQTDLSLKELVALGRLAPGILDQGVATQVLPGRNQKIDELWYWLADRNAKEASVSTSNLVAQNEPQPEPQTDQKESQSEPQSEQEEVAELSEPQPEQSEQQEAAEQSESQSETQPATQQPPEKLAVAEG